jgi:hypothetical protein
MSYRLSNALEIPTGIDQDQKASKRAKELLLAPDWTKSNHIGGNHPYYKWVSCGSKPFTRSA